jgi:hypothetical protein
MGRLALDAVMKGAKAVTLLALLAPIVSACGPSGPDINARRLPHTLDLDRREADTRHAALRVRRSVAHVSR